jgi:hydroxyacylglutathione hydrolase
VQSINAKELRERLNEVNVIDVRRLSEWESGHIPNATHIEGGRLAWEELNLPQDKPLVIQCASGNRSMVAISVLKRQGYKNILQAEGGINQWKLNNFEVVR